MTDDELDQRIRTSFEKQGFMRTIGAQLGAVKRGRVEIILKPHADVCQQDGFVHGGALGAIADSAAGYAALSVMPTDRRVLTTDYKINFLAPARGDRIIALGEVMKSGRTLSLAQTKVFSENDGQERLIALLTATLISLENVDGISD